MYQTVCLVQVKYSHLSLTLSATETVCLVQTSTNPGPPAGSISFIFVSPTPNLRRGTTCQFCLGFIINILCLPRVTDLGRAHLMGSHAYIHGTPEQLIHPRSAAFHTLSHSGVPALFMAPYPVANLTVTLDIMIQSPNPCLISGADPLASSIWAWMACKVEYLHWISATPHTPTQPLPSVQVQLPYIPPW